MSSLRTLLHPLRPVRPAPLVGRAVGSCLAFFTRQQRLQLRYKSTTTTVSFATGLPTPPPPASPFILTSESSTSSDPSIPSNSSPSTPPQHPTALNASKPLSPLPPLAYHVARTDSKELPVYTTVKASSKHLVLVRRVTGDSGTLAYDLRQKLRLPKERVQIKRRPGEMGRIEFKVDMKNSSKHETKLKVLDWLKKKGF